MKARYTWRERRPPSRRIQIAAIAVAAVAFLVAGVGNWLVATVAVCPSGGGWTAFAVQTLLFLSPMALFAVGAWMSRDGRTRPGRALWGLGMAAAILMFLFGWVLLIAITMNCSRAENAETAYFAGAWVFGLAAALGGAVLAR